MLVDYALALRCQFQNQILELRVGGGALAACPSRRTVLERRGPLPSGVALMCYGAA